MGGRSLRTCASHEPGSLQGSESACSIGQLQKVNSLWAATIRTRSAEHRAYRSVASVGRSRFSYPPGLQFLWAVFGLRILATILLCCLCVTPRAQAGATLFLGEPYGYDGAFAGTGHAAVYLSGVCAISPVVLRTIYAFEIETRPESRPGD